MSTLSSPSRTTTSQIRSTSARGCGSIDITLVWRPCMAIARRATFVELPEPISKYLRGLWVVTPQHTVKRHDVQTRQKAVFPVGSEWRGCGRLILQRDEIFSYLQQILQKVRISGTVASDYSMQDSVRRSATAWLRMHVVFELNRFHRCVEEGTTTGRTRSLRPRPARPPSSPGRPSRSCGNLPRASGCLP